MQESMTDPLAISLGECRKTLWGRFVDRHGILLDYANDEGKVDLPTPDDCRLGIPNAIGWYSPIANGSFFTGLHLYGLSRLEKPCNEEIKMMSRLAEGLVKLADCSDVPGFIGRGLGSDGRCHYPTGSDDQTHPWFLGLGMFLLSGHASDTQRTKISQVLISTGQILETREWKIPCDGSFLGQWRSDLKGFEFRASAQLLSILKILHLVSGDSYWEKRYLEARDESEVPGGPTRRQICAQGCLYDLERIPDIRTQMWIVAGAQASLLHLQAWDSEAKGDYLEGLKKTGEVAIEGLRSAKKFNPDDATLYRLHHWRENFPVRKIQTSQKEAQAFALEQMQVLDQEDAPGLSRRILERYFVQQPLASAAVLASAMKAGCVSVRESEIYEVLKHYPYSKLQNSGFFFADLVGCLLRLDRHSSLT